MIYPTISTAIQNEIATTAVCPVVYIHASDVLNTINAIPSGAFYHIIFEREYPKCTVCEAKSKKWKTEMPTSCPKCGGEVSYIADHMGQNGVHNPKAVVLTGTGVSNKEAQMLWGNFKFYDPQLLAYRSAKAENVLAIKSDKKIYLVV